MNWIGFRRSTDEQLIEAFANAAIERSKTKSVRKANRHADKIFRIARILKKRGPASRAKVLALLEHPDPEVTSWAAAYALTFAPEKAEPVLRSVAAEPGSLGFSAEITLDEYHKGTFRFIGDPGLPLPDHNDRAE